MNGLGTGIGWAAVGRRYLLPLLGCAAALLGGCRYRTGSGLPDEIRTVHVGVLENQTRVRGLETEVTAALVEALATGGRLRLAPAGEADAELTGMILAYRRESLAQDRFADAVELRVVLEARVTLRDRRKNADLLHEEWVSSRQTDLEAGLYDLRRGVPESVGRARAVRALSENIARKVLDRW